MFVGLCDNVYNCQFRKKGAIAPDVMHPLSSPIYTLTCCVRVFLCGLGMSVLPCQCSNASGLREQEARLICFTTIDFYLLVCLLYKIRYLGTLFYLFFSTLLKQKSSERFQSLIFSVLNYLTRVKHHSAIVWF